MTLTLEQKEKIAYRIVQDMDMDNLIDSAAMAILKHWDEYPTDLEEELKERPYLKECLKVTK